MNIRHFSVVLVILVAVLSRLIPHPPNFTPIIAMGLFSGFYFKNNKSLALLLPLTAMIISDIILGFYLISLFVYSGLIFIVLIGLTIPNKEYKTSFHNILAGSLASSLIFFIISNLGVFFIGYPNTLEGLIACFIAAIPFFQTSISSDLLFTTVIFLSYDIIRNNIPQLNPNIA